MTGPARRLASALSRRRAIVLLAAAGGLGLSCRGLLARDSRAASLTEWQGSVLGAESRMLLVHPDRQRAARILDACLAEVARLEQIFSLYCADSELTRLNRDGRIIRPSLDLKVVLEEAHRVSLASNGAFDVTIQPLWRLLADHQGRSVPPKAFEAARHLVAFTDVDIASRTIGLARDHMAVTLNGIAQGYITDRVADLLEDAGFDRVLMQLGESRALEPPRAGGVWQTAIPDPRGTGHDLWTLALERRALATSSGLALVFDAQGPRHHLLNAKTGESPNHYLSVSVLASRAMRADALSTALYVLPPEAAAATIARLGGGEALILHRDGRTSRLAVGGPAA
ncbi:MAG: FAD:protein FMN transferase [Alphaproteobacteria bacterium]